MDVWKTDDDRRPKHKHLEETDENVMVVIHTMPDRSFTRVDNVHLYMNHTITLREALVGFSLAVRHPRGHIVNVNKIEVTPPGSLLEVSKEGFPHYDNPEKRGNLYVGISVEFPSFLSVEKREGLDPSSFKTKQDNASRRD